ncbi:MAG: hypothetical protein NVV83_20015 [Afipia sp.]|nr:hypothetical protein [Afipia sp.]
MWTTLLDSSSITVAPPRFEAGGWMHWPDNEDYSLQFMRVLGSAQEGGSTISECFLTASRIVTGDDESWYREWNAIADANKARGRSGLCGRQSPFGMQQLAAGFQLLSDLRGFPETG